MGNDWLLLVMLKRDLKAKNQQVARIPAKTKATETARCGQWSRGYRLEIVEGSSDQRRWKTNTRSPDV
jgi:hypothetical protein